MGFDFECLPVEIDERSIGNRLTDSPKTLVLEIARAKAKEGRKKSFRVLDILPGALLLAGDQVAVHEGRILEKPRTASEAAAFIRGYSRAPCQTVASVCLVDLHSGKSVEGVDTANIHFRAMPESIIETLVDEGECFHCAGGLMIEHVLLQPYIERIDGTLDSVMGLPKSLVTQLISQLTKRT